MSTPTTSLDDIFHPRVEPASSIYEAFKREARLRPRRALQEWIETERNAVFRAAETYAHDHGVAVPTLAQIEAAERYAMESTDYGAKWSYGVARLLEPAAARR